MTKSTAKAPDGYVDVNEWPVDGALNLRGVSVTYTRKVNMGKYESAEVSMVAWADVYPGADAAAIAAAVRQYCRNNVWQELVRQGYTGLPENVEAKVKEMFMGLEIVQMPEEDNDADQ